MSDLPPTPPPPPPPVPPSEGVKRKVTLPAIALIVTGAANIVVSLLHWVNLLLTLGRPARTYANEAQRAGAMTANVLMFLASLASVLVAPVLIYAGIRMMQGRSYPVARAASIMAMIPFTSCCCLLGLPAGIWAFVTLRQPEVVAYFRR